MSHSQGPNVLRRILMLGFGVTGRAVCEFATRHALPIRVSEQGRLSEEQQSWLVANDIPFEHAGHTPKFLPDVDVVVLSPGISLNLPMLEEARQRGLPVLSEIDFALGLLGDRSVIAVTGTNGKSATVEVIGKILSALGREAWVAGNIGIPLISIIDDIAESDIIVLEISSYQLEQSRDFRPQIGVLLNLSPDHIHRHGDMRAYANAKGKLFTNQGPDDMAILPSTLASQFGQGRGRRVFYDRDLERFPASMEMLLPHERANLRAALAACDALLPEFDAAAVPMDIVSKAFRLAHRMEILGDVGGVRVINDSKSTNAASATAALRSTESPVVLLLGGRYKGAGYESLIDEIAASDIREVILFGEAADALRRVFEQRAFAGFAPLSVQTMREAVTRGLLVARPGDVLLLSPGCSSFDAFADYVERGELFADLIRSQPGFESV